MFKQIFAIRKPSVIHIIQVFHTELVKVVLQSIQPSSKMIQEKATLAVTIALIFEKNKPRKKRQKKEVSVTNLGLKEEKT